MWYKFGSSQFRGIGHYAEGWCIMYRGVYLVCKIAVYTWPLINISCQRLYATSSMKVKFGFSIKQTRIENKTLNRYQDAYSAASLTNRASRNQGNQQGSQYSMPKISSMHHAKCLVIIEPLKNFD